MDHARRSAAGRHGVRGALVLLAMGSACSSPPPAPSGRITEPIDPTRAALAIGNVHPRAQDVHDIGRMDPATVLPGITLDLSLSARQSSELTALLAAQRDRSSPSYHAWLTPEEYGERFGLGRSDIAKIVGWLEGQGFTVQRVARGAREITVAGTAAQVEATFHTEVHRYRVDGHEHFAISREPSLPEALSGVVVGLGGLDDFAPLPQYNVGATHYVAPGDFAAIFDVEKLYAMGIDGTGVTIAVTGSSYYNPGDITQFRSLTGLPPLDLQDILVPNSGMANFLDGSVTFEWESDIQTAGSIARNAKVVFVYTGGAVGFNVLNSLKYAIDNKVADIVSNSWGGCELKGFSPAGIAAIQKQVNQANAQGMTIIAATGDSGPAECDGHKSSAAVMGLAALFPASLPEVTAVGGTTLTEGAGSYWGASNGPNLGSALSYIPEAVWNDSVVTNGLWSGGGGKSDLFPKPSWQVGKGVPNDGLRDVPDVALPASQKHDQMLAYFSPPIAPAGFYPTSGTSVSTPAFAGIVALAQHAIGKGGLGNINPTLYALAAQSPAAFHDVTMGDNIVPCTTSNDCPPAGKFGYTAGPGYDLASGLGSVDVFELVTAWVACEKTGCDMGSGGAGGGAGSGGAGASGTGGTEAAGTGGAAAGAGGSDAGAGGASAAGAGGASAGGASLGGAGGASPAGAGGASQAGAAGASQAGAGGTAAGAGGASPAGAGGAAVGGFAGASPGGKGGSAGAATGGGAGASASGGSGAAAGGTVAGGAGAGGGKGGSVSAGGTSAGASGSAGAGALDTAATDTSGGCGCAIPRRSVEAPLGAVGIGVFALVLRRRRRA